MKLREFLALSRSLGKHPNVLSDSVGDAVLYERNPLFRRIRDETIGLGYRFVKDDPYHYFSLKLNALDRLKAGRVLPYLPNLDALAELEKEAPGSFTLRETGSLGLTSNVTTMHESCHVVAASIVAAEASAARTAPKQFVVDANLEEAFTDTVETLNHVFNRSGAERFSARFNMYIQPINRKETAILNRLVREHGLGRLARAMILLSLACHCLRADIGEASLRRLQELSDGFPLFSVRKQAARDRLELLILLRRPVTAFRIEVAAAYFKVHGLRGGIVRILAFDPFALMLSQRARYTGILDRLAGLVGN